MSFSASTQQTSAAPTASAGGGSDILLASEIDISKIEYSDLASSKTNSTFKSAYINYTGAPSGRLVVQTPWLYTWDGISQPPEEYRQPGAPPKYALNFSLRGHKENEEVMGFQTFLHALDEKILNDASSTHSIAWFKQKKKEYAQCEAIFTRQLKRQRDKETYELTDEFPPSFKCKVPCYDGTWKCQLFDATTQHEIEGDLSAHLQGKCHVRAVLRCQQIWFAGGKFGVTWQLQLAEYRSDEAQLRGYRFRRTAEDAAMLEAAPAQATAQAQKATAKPLATAQEYSEEEVEDSDVE